MELQRLSGTHRWCLLRPKMVATGPERRKGKDLSAFVKCAIKQCCGGVEGGFGGWGGGISTYSSRKDLLLEVKEKNRSHVSIPTQERGGRAPERPQTCVVEVGGLDELGRHRLLVVAILVLDHQPIHAVVDVGGVDQLQAAVVLALRGLVDPGADVVLLLERLVVVVPLQIGFGVALHGEGDAPVVVPLRLHQLLDAGGD